MYKITQINGIKTYNMSAGKTLPQFMQEAKKTHKSLRYDQQFKRRIQLIQDFQFDVATNQVQISKDQRYIIAAGIYGPQIKIYDTAQLSLKCLRGVDSEVVKFTILSDDYSKIAMAQHDRSIQFHAQYGTHFKTRIPHFPRDLTYNPICANLCISASANEIYRLSLEEGKFLTPFATESYINTLDFNDKLNILVCGGDSLQIWDFRERNRVCLMKTAKTISKVKCDSTGLLIGVGQGSSVNIYDVRFDRKLMSMKSSYNEPINSISFLNNHQKSIIFSNKAQIKVHDANGNFFTSIQPDNGINSLTTVADTGMILVAMQDPKIGCFFIPQLGPAPKWVPYIENITQQLEEDEKKMVYDEYKFVSKQQVFELGCNNLVNTKMLKEYMHGYLMHIKLYNQVKHKLQGQNYLQKRQQMIEDQVQKDIPKRIEKKQEIKDQRFIKMMTDNPDYTVNKLSDQYIIRHPHLKWQIIKEKEQQQIELEKRLRLSKATQEKLKGKKEKKINKKKKQTYHQNY